MSATHDVCAVKEVPGRDNNKEAAMILNVLTYDKILAEIRRHQNDPLIGKGKFSWEERLADHLLCLFNTSKSLSFPISSVTSVTQTSLTQFPVGTVQTGLPNAGSQGSSPEEPTLPFPT